MGHLWRNNVHPQQFTDNYDKNFSVNVKKLHQDVFFVGQRCETTKSVNKSETWNVIVPDHPEDHHGGQRGLAAPREQPEKYNF